MIEFNGVTYLEVPEITEFSCEGCDCEVKGECILENTEILIECGTKRIIFKKEECLKIGDTVEIEGKQYIASEGIENSYCRCDGCAFYAGWGCDIPDPVDCVGGNFILKAVPVTKNVVGSKNWIHHILDKNDNIISTTSSTGYWAKYEYDEAGNLIKTTNSDGSTIPKPVNCTDGDFILKEVLGTEFEIDNVKYKLVPELDYGQCTGCVFEKDENCSIICGENIVEPVNWVHHILDKNGNMVRTITNTGYWAKTKYNENGDPVYSENSEGYSSKTTYDAEGNELKTTLNKPKTKEYTERVIIDGKTYESAPEIKAAECEGCDLSFGKCRNIECDNVIWKLVKKEVPVLHEGDTWIFDGEEYIVKCSHNCEGCIFEREECVDIVDCVTEKVALVKA